MTYEDEDDDGPIQRPGESWSDYMDRVRNWEDDDRGWFDAESIAIGEPRGG